MWILHRYKAGGWVRKKSPFRMQRVDQGQDFEIPRNEFIRAPGPGVCVAHFIDGPFPNGFGSPCAIVKITKGRFAVGDGLWYVGHCNSDVIPVGRHFKFQDKLARANHGLYEGWGWAEIGKCVRGGIPGPMGTGEKYAELFRPIFKVGP